MRKHGEVSPYIGPFALQHSPGLPAAPASTVREKLQAEGKDVAIPDWSRRILDDKLGI